MTQFPEVFDPPPARDPWNGICRWCCKELPEVDWLSRRLYCCHAHRQRAYEERHGLKTGETFTTRNRKNH